MKAAYQMFCNNSSPVHVSECEFGVSEVDSVPSTLQQSSSARVHTTFSRGKTVAGYAWISCVQLLTVKFSA